jgi:serine/threonine protein kinase/tetratricopeptide (TPR) repeat protein
MALDAQRVQAVFQAALEAPDPAARAAVLERECATDPEVSRRVQALLQAYENPASILDRPPVAAVPVTVDDAPPERPGTMIGSYKLIEPIGEGGMGTVWMAQQTEPVKRLVAVKVIKAGMDSKQVIARFEAERQALALMDHPNIARVLDGGTTGAGRPYFVMDLVKGVPITRYCDEHHLTPRQRLELFLPVCQAVQHAHQKGVIHRDLKPTNVLVALYDGKPVPKVIDFGVAKAAGQSLTDKTLVTGFGVIVGTLEYMSPEQAEVNQIDIDTRSDIYSLGVVLYELLAGSPPFTRKELEKAGVLEMLRVIREQEPSKPSTKLSTAEGLPTLAANRGTEPAKLTKLVRGELDWIVMKALEKDRNRRYETANGFAMDVQRYLADEAVLACPPSAGYRFKKFMRRNKGPVIAVSVILLCLVAGIIGTSAGLIWAVRERDDKAKALIAEAKVRDQAMTSLRDLVDDIVENQMARGTTMTEENKEFLRKIIKHFESFAALTADDADSRAIRAEGYYRVGRMRYFLGEMKEAETALADGLALYQRLAVEFPNKPEFLREVARCHHILGQLYWKTDRLTKAETGYADALAIQKPLVAEFPRPEFRQELARSHNSLGILLAITGRLEKAETAYGDAIAIQTPLAAEFPARSEFRWELASSHLNLGTLFANTSRPKDAETAYRNALAIQKKLADDFPTRPEFRRYLAMSQNNLGNLLKDTGQDKKAETAYRDALAIRKQLAAEFSTRPEFRSELAMSHNNLGTLLSETKDRVKEAEKEYADALAIQKPLADDFPKRREFRGELAGTYSNLGNLLKDTGRVKEAESAYADALKIRKQLAADFPDQTDFQNDVADTFYSLARLCNHRRDFKAARAHLEEALPYHLAALKANSRNPQYREWFRDHLMVLVHTNAGLQDQAAAVQAAEKLRDLGWDPPGNAYDAVRALAYCICVVKTDDQLDAAKRQAAVQFYADEAMKMLRDAIAKGYRNVEQMNTDKYLDPLRQREDFKKLLAEVEAKSK